MSKIFNSIEELNTYFGTEIELPKNIPEDCNVVCFQVSFKEGVEFFHAYKENEQGLFSLDSEGNWEKSSKSLKDEVEWDKTFSNSPYAYLRLEQKDVFTPDCLVGVETDKGFITCVIQIGWDGIFKPSYFVYTTESLSKEDLHDVHNVKFYISDYSDDVVSFKEYIELFYEG